ncbi:GIP, partial [Symbiodinium sp. CCMP2456]
IDAGHQNEWADIEMPDGSVRKCDDPRGHTGEPWESERRLRESTHLSCRDWCDHWVRSKGRQSHAVKKNDRQPVIQIDFSDFSFLATENDLPKRTILSATEVQTAYSMAVVWPAKGSIEKYAVPELHRFVFEIGRTFGIVQYDKEFTEGDCLQGDWWTVDARSTDWKVKLPKGGSQWFSGVYLGKDTEADEEEEENEENEQLEDMVSGQSESLTVRDILDNDGSDREMRLAEPLLWESEFPPEAEKKGMIKKMKSMKEFDVYDEVMVKDLH